MEYQDFKNEVLGKGFDIDGMYGWQCLTSGHMVKLADNSFKDVSELAIGDKLSTGNTVVSNKSQEVPTYWLRTSQGTFKVTENHRVFTKEGVKQVNELIKGKDEILLDLFNHSVKYNLTKDELRFLGFWLGDGTVKYRWKHTKMPEVLVTVGTESKYDYIENLNVNTRYTSHSNGKARIYTLINQEHMELNQIIHSHNDKCLPDEFSAEQYKYIIEGYLKADGYLKRNTYVASSVNKSILALIQHGCHLNGWSAVMSKKMDREATNLCNHPRPQWRLTINKERKFLNNFISLEFAGMDTVYVLNTDGDHSYYADNQLHHNCWDGYAQYCKWLGVPYANCNVTGYVRDLWEQRASNGMLNNFDEVEVMQPGDVAVFKVVSGWTPYSHVAIFDSDIDGAYGWFLGQNQNGEPTNPNGGSAFNLVKLPYWTTYQTAFRPKHFPEDTPKKEDVKPVTNPTETTQTVTKRILNKNDIVLDVASYQQENLQNTTSQAGTRNTFVKATEGTSYKNPKMSGQSNSSDVKGYYHFARFGGNVTKAQEEANYFLSVIGNGDGTKYAILDYETGASGDVNSNTQAIMTFMRAVKENGWNPLFYSYTSYMNNFNIDSILGEFPKSFWEAWYATTAPSNAPTWEYKNRLSGKASIWQWTDNYKGLNVDASVVLEDLNSETTTKEIREEDLDMGMYALRSKSGKNGYVGIIDGVPFGIDNWGTVAAITGEGGTHITFGSDTDFQRFWDAYTKRYNAQINQADALIKLGNKL